MSDNESVWDDDIVDEPVEVVEKPKPKRKAAPKAKAKPAPAPAVDILKVRVLLTNPLGRRGDILDVPVDDRRLARFLSTGVVEPA